MKKNDYYTKTGFTLIELLVVIAIIGLLSTLSIVGLNSSRKKARDANRRHDLDQIRTSLLFYYDDYGNWMSTGSGCGYGGNGNGWFNYTGGSYPESMAQCLIDEGYVDHEIIDPSGGITSTPTSGNTYMKYTCNYGKTTYIYAKLETVDQSASATDGTCCANCDSSYGMNYYIKIE